MKNQLVERKPYKIVLGTSLDEYDILLRVKRLLGERFYVRNIDNNLENGFVIALFAEDVERLDEDLKGRVVPMSDEGIKRHCVSFLYRFVDNQYIDEFVKGKFRLSTFKRCKGLEDKNRVDGNEGSIEFYSDNRKIAGGFVGENGYLFCSSLTPFASGSIPGGKCIIIIDPEGFISAVTAAIRKLGYAVSAIVQGPCVYTDHRVALSYEPEHTEENLVGLLDAIGDRIYMMKDALPRHMVEHEYRIVWLMDEEVKGEYIDIEIEHPERYLQSMIVPPYKSCVKPIAVAARNHPIIFPAAWTAGGLLGNITVV